MSIQKTEAVVLRTYEVRETSLITSFYTRTFGKVSCLVKGIRRTPNRFACYLGPLTYNKIIFYHRRHRGLHTLAEAELLDDFFELALDPRKLATASYFAELVEELTRPEDKNEDIFTLLLKSIQFLRDGKPMPALRGLFEIRLLQFSGFMPRLDSCSNCGQRFPGEKAFSAASGGILCPRCRGPEMGTISEGTVASLKYLAKGEMSQAVELKMLPTVEKELQNILRDFIAARIEKNLKSVEFLEKLTEFTQHLFFKEVSHSPKISAGSNSQTPYEL